MWLKFSDKRSFAKFMKKVFLLSSSASLSLAIEGLLCDCHSTCKGPELVYYCGTDEEDVWVNPCFSDAYSSLSFCDESLDIKSRVADLILRIPDDEKLGSAGNSDFEFDLSSHIISCKSFS